MLELPPRDGDAFFVFYTTYLLTVLGVLQRIGVRKEDVPDIAQQVFLKIYRNMDKMPTERVHAWIEVICKQQAAEHYRLHRNRFETPVPNVGEDLPHGDDVHEQYERCEMEAFVKKVLDGMDAALRDVLVRYEFQDEPLESIAESLGIVPNTVRARLVEAKRIFGIRAKKLLGDEHRSSMLVPLFVGADVLSDADLQTPTFVEEMRASIWNRIARDLGFTPNPPEPSFASQSTFPKSPSTLRRILENRGVIATSSAVAGFVAALLWPRDVPAVAKHLAMVPPAIVVPNHKSDQAAVTADPSLAMATAAPNSVKSTAHNTTTAVDSHVDHELRMLEEARKFIVNTRYAEAIATLTQHQQEFPRSQFATTRSRYMALAQEGQKRAAATIATTP